MKKNQKAEKRNSKPRNRSKEQNVSGSDDHRANNFDSNEDYDALFDEIDQYDLATSERFFMEELDRKSRSQRTHSRRRYWSPEWDQDVDDWD